MYFKVFKKDGEVVREEIQYKDLPIVVKKMFNSKKGINYVEEGVCCDLSNYRGYYWEKETDKLIQKTGSDWNFIPFCAYIKEV